MGLQVLICLGPSKRRVFGRSICSTPAKWERCPSNSSGKRTCPHGKAQISPGRSIQWKPTHNAVATFHQPQAKARHTVAPTSEHGQGRRNANGSPSSRLRKSRQQLSRLPRSCGHSSCKPSRALRTKCNGVWPLS